MEENPHPHADGPDSAPHEIGEPEQVTGGQVIGDAADELGAALDVGELAPPPAMPLELTDDEELHLLSILESEAAGTGDQADLAPYLDEAADTPRLIGRCGAHARTSGRPCVRPAGWGTTHPGQGKCRAHGGATPILHGRFSSIRRPRLLELIEDQAEDAGDELDLRPELRLLRAIVVDYVERHDALNDAILAWHESFNTGDATPKPRQLPDLAAAGKLLAEIGALVERIQKQQRAGSISLEVVERFLDQLGAEVVTAAKKVIPDGPTRTALVQAVGAQWASVRLDVGKPRPPRPSQG